MGATVTVQATKTVYRDEFIAAYEQSKSLLATATTPQTQTEGNVATFLIAGSGGQRAVTRGQNGQIPYNTPSNTQVSVTLVEKHAPFELTGFDIFSSQGNQKQIIQDASMAVIRRDQDLIILTELANATQDYGSGSLELATIAMSKAILGQNFVDTSNPDDMFWIISPAAEAYLMQMPEFTSADYVSVTPMEGGQARNYRRWMGSNWMVSALVTGVGTASEVLYNYHRSALGYAANMGGEKVNIGYDEKQDSSWSRATIYHQAKILQNSGIIKVAHDGSAALAT